MHSQKPTMGWKLTNSIGFLWILCTGGVLACVPFLYRGIKQRNKSIIGIGVFFLLTVLLMFSIVDQTSESPAPPNGYDTVFTGLIMINLIAGSVLFWLYNASWLQFRAAQEATSQQRRYYPPAAQQPYTSGPGTYGPGTWPAPGAMVININTASEAQLHMLGMQHDVVLAVLSARQITGQFMNFDHLVQASGVPPQFLLPFRDRFIYSAVLPPNLS